MTEIKELTLEIKRLGDITKEVYSAIQGNDALGQKGLKHTIEDHTTRLERLERFKSAHETSDAVTKATEGSKRWRDRIVGMSAGAGATATAMAPKSIWAKIAAMIASWFN